MSPAPPPASPGSAPSTAAAATAPGRVAHVIAVASGKGGVGKTWLSVTLAHALARRRIKSLLFDGDLGLANVDVQLGLMPARDLMGFSQGTWRLADCAITHTDAGFDVVAGRSGVAALALMQPAQLQALREDLVLLSRGYRRVILDLGAGVDRPVRALAALAGITLVVTQDEPTALTDAYAFLKLAWMSQPRADLRLVVNMADSPAQGARTHATLARACRTFLERDLPLAGIIRRDPKVRDAIRHQTPILTRSPTAPAAVDVEALAAALLGPR